MFEVFEFGYLVVGYIKDAEVCLLAVSEERGGWKYGAHIVFQTRNFSDCIMRNVKFLK